MFCSDTFTKIVITVVYTRKSSLLYIIVTIQINILYLSGIGKLIAS